MHITYYFQIDVGEHTLEFFCLIYFTPFAGAVGKNGELLPEHLNRRLAPRAIKASAQQFL